MRAISDIAKQTGVRSTTLVDKVNRLQSRLRDRPTDQRALQELYEAMLDIKDYSSAADVAQRAIDCGEFSGTLYLQLGRCLFRKWPQWKQVSDIRAALVALKTAMADDKVNRQPIIYLELVTVYSRLGMYQDAIDTLGAFMVIFKSSQDLLMLAKYNVAVIMCLAGRFEEATRLYRDLVHCPRDINLDLSGRDHIISLPLHMSEPVLYLELGALLLKMGQRQHAGLLLKENFCRIKKYKYFGWNAAMFNKIMTTPSTFDDWFTDYRTFKDLGVFFRQNYNMFMASEMFAISSAIVGHIPYENLDPDSRELLLSLSLDSAECLAEMCSFKLAEKHAHRAFELAPSDMIVVDRAAKCCRPNVKENEKIFAASRMIWKACRRVHSVLRGKILKRRKLIERRYELSATKINAFIRMVLTRNRTAGDRLSDAPIRRINILVAKLTGKVLKKGSEQIEMWAYLWFTAATQIQTMMRQWLALRRYRKFTRGCAVMKKVFRGQIQRKWLRVMVQKLQERLNVPGFDDAAKIELLLELDSDRWPFYIDIFEKKALCSGTTCLSADEIVPGVVSVSDACSPLRQRDRHERKALGREGISVLKARNFSQRSLASRHSPESSKSVAELNSLRIFNMGEDKADKRKVHRLKPIPKIDVPANVSSKIETNLDILSTQEDCKEPAVAEYVVTPLRQCSITIGKGSVQSKGDNMSKTFDGRLPNMGTNITMPSDLYHPISGQSTNYQELTSPTRMPKLVSTREHTTSTYSVDDFIIDPSEDVISMISMTSLSKDHSKQWIPFGMMPDIEITRILKCTVLVITSPSFSMQDSRRLCAISTNGAGNWNVLRSLIIFGTRMGESGVNMILSMGIAHLQSLTLGNTGVSYHIAALIGEQLIQKRPDVPKSLSKGTTINLSKIYFEHEHNFGDRGAVELVKLLQHNNTVKILSLKDCCLGLRGAKACARYISQATRLEVVNLSENYFDFDGCVSLVRAVANRGSKGYLRRLYLKSLKPILSHPQILSLYQLSSALAVGFVADNLNAEEETKSELLFNKDSNEDDIQRMRNAFFDVVKENKLVAAGEMSYKKTIFF